MNDSAATLARTAARLRPLCVIHHAMCHHLHIRGGEGGHRCCAARARENQNEEAVADAPKVKAMRTSVGWFSNIAGVRCDLSDRQVHGALQPEGLRDRQQVSEMARG